MTKTKKRMAVCEALKPYGTSVFTDMSLLAAKHDAVNLSQGFPDFDGPKEIRSLAAEAILAGPNQYSPTIGVKSFRNAVADKMKRFYGVVVDPDTQVTATAGATEALAATFLGIVEPGDQVILLEPSYDLYPAMVARAGGEPVFVPLQAPSFALDEEALRSAFTSKTRAIVINNPQNPCGKVFTENELKLIGELCNQYDAYAVGDEVYEHLVYDGKPHITLASVDGLKDRSIVVSSTAKTFSMTGWKVGYTVAPPELTDAVRMAHQFLTYCTPGMFQKAMAAGISMGDDYYEELLADYTRKRTTLCAALEDMGFSVLRPEGTYYCSVDISGLGFEDDLDFCRHITEEAKVAAIPSSYFWKERRGGRNLVRFCFCKTDETLNEGIKRLQRWRNR